MEKNTDQRLRWYGLALFLGMGLTTWVLIDRQIPYAYYLTGTLSALGLILGLFVPQALSPIYAATRAWGALLGNLISWVLTVPLYYLLFTPLALLIRLLGGDSMSPRKTRGWKTVPEKDNDPQQMNRLW